MYGFGFREPKIWSVDLPDLRARMKETTGGEFRVYRASIRLL